MQVREKIKEDPSVENGLKSVKYSSRYALCLFYNAKVEIDEPWDVKYIYDDEIFRYVAIDNKKRNKADSPPAIVLHTTITYGEENVERNISDVQSDLLAHVKKVFPGWPEPDFVKCQKWRYSQVVTPYPGNPGFIIVQQDPLLIACGDGFTRSTVDGCVVSAEKVANFINTIKDIGKLAFGGNLPYRLQVLTITQLIITDPHTHRKSSWEPDGKAIYQDDEEAAIHVLPTAASAENPDNTSPVDANSQPGPFMELQVDLSMEQQPGPSTAPSSAPLTFTWPCDKKKHCAYEEYIAAADDITVWGILKDADDIIREQQESNDRGGGRNGRRSLRYPHDKRCSESWRRLLKST
uniref:(California timema) hypothetical protein n=1 Tax=Timema californicum TaxID=61474 RepID=A0A7R9J0J5_TIMCA|nr:unnamed protein product [Timema californicum]